MVWLCGCVAVSRGWPLDGWLSGCSHLAHGPGPSTDSLVSLPYPDPEPNLVVRPSLESLLAASSHMLKEVLESPFSDPLKNLRLPRELSSNKKYSWMQKKEERVSLRGGRGSDHPAAFAFLLCGPQWVVSPLLAFVPFSYCVRHVLWVQWEWIRRTWA